MATLVRLDCSDIDCHFSLTKVSDEQAATLRKTGRAQILELNEADWESYNYTMEQYAKWQTHLMKIDNDWLEAKDKKIAAPVYWHVWNPWRDQVVYVPVEELAEAIAGGEIQIQETGEVVPYNAEYILKQWRDQHVYLDAYILPQPSGRHDVGVRYGSNPEQYRSPYAGNPAKISELLNKYRRTP